LAIVLPIVLSPLVLANFLLYMPVKVIDYAGIPATAFGANGKAINFPSANGKTLCGYLFKRPGARFTVLLSHGQGGNLETHFGLAKTMLQAGCSVMTYDYQGFGKSSGVASSINMQQDGEAAYRYLTDVQHLKPSEIILCGISLGSGVASHIAEKNRCAAVILISPYTSLKQVAIERNPLFRFYPASFFPQPDLGSLSFVRSNSAIPILLIHGVNDPIISAIHAQELDKAARAPHWLILEPKAHHGDFSTTFLSQQIKLFIEKALARPDVMQP
jgi:hypothetical protein